MSLQPLALSALKQVRVAVSGCILVVQIGLGFMVAWSPERYWWRLALVVAFPDILASYRPFNRGGRRSLVRATGRGRDTWVERLPALRSYWFGGWNPALRLEGEEHVRAALARGHGAILWVAPLRYHSLVTKKAFHAAGIPVHHLSHSRHGFGPHPWAIARLSRIRTRVEDRYLASRVMFGPHGVGAMKATGRLRAHLLANRVVSITLNEDGAQLADMRIGGWHHPIATGAPHLAVSTGAALLPVFCVRERNGSYSVRIGAPLTSTAGVSRKAAIVELVNACSEAFDPVVRAYPDQLPRRFANRRGLG